MRFKKSLVRLKQIHPGQLNCYRQNFMAGFSLLEVVIVISLAVIIFGGIIALQGPFAKRQQLEYSAVKLVGDLRQAQQYAYSQRVGIKDSTEYAYKYYGVHFFPNVGEDDNNDATKDREGWKIVRYEPPAGVDPDEMDAAQSGHLDIDRYTVIKGSEAADNPEFLEKTYFAKGVIFNTVDSDFKVGDSIVFTPEGAATTDGTLANLVSDISGDGIVGIVLFSYNRNKTIKIAPLTGHVGIR